MRLRRLAALLVALFALTALPPSPPLGAAPPTGFESAVLSGLSGLSQPTAFAFLPDGAMLIATKAGRLRLYRNGALRAEPVLDLSAVVCTESERGLLGVAVDPAFSANTNRYIYIYYTFKKNNSCGRNNEDTEPVNRVSRLTLTADLTATSEQVLIDNIPSPNGNHNAGDMHIGKDGQLYVSTGDGGSNAELARQRHLLAGKILRITRDGEIPTDNPYQGTGTARCNTGKASSPSTLCQEIFAYGFRNPYRLAFDPNAAGTRFYINDVGAGTVEEISQGAAGGDFGWPCFEGTRANQASGPCQGVSFQSTVAPTFDYRREGAFAGCASITGGAFVPAGQWPAQYDAAYLFGDFVCGRIFALFPNGTTQLFEGSANGVTHMAFGPDGAGQALYYASFHAGTITRVRFSGGANRAPTARVSATPLFGEPPLAVNFDAGASSDPDAGDTITAYLWDFGDGATAETSGPTAQHTYEAANTYTASVRVRDNRGALSASAATVRIDAGNDPPAPQILAPAAGTRFSVGESFTLRGSASDPEDGNLSGARLSWEVRRHHDQHFHPYLDPTSGLTATFTAPGPEDLAAVSTSWLEVRLTATDAAGLTTTVTREIRPQIVTLRLETEPPGLQVSVGDGVATTALTTPVTVRSWAAWKVTLSAPADQRSGGVTMQLCGWRHGGAPSQAYVTPSVDTNVRAVFGPANQPCAAQIGDEQIFLPQVRR